MNFYTNLTFKVQKGRGLGHVTQFQILWPLITFERIELYASNLVHAYRTHPSFVWTTERPLSRRGLGHVTQFRNRRTRPPCNLWTNWGIRFKFGTDVEDVSLLRTDHKTAPNWAWPRSRDPNSKIWDPLITFESIDLSASTLVQRCKTYPSCVWTSKWPISGRGPGHVTNIENLGPPYNWQNITGELQVY